MRFALFGAGRAGTIHARNIAAHPRAELGYIFDVDQAAAQRLVDARGGLVPRDPQQIWEAGDVDAVLIASSTDTHVDLLRQAMRAGKPAYCEKPIDLDIEKVRAFVDEASANDPPVFVGFRRRFQPEFSSMQRQVRGRRNRTDRVDPHHRPRLRAGPPRLPAALRRPAARQDDPLLRPSPMARRREAHRTVRNRLQPHRSRRRADGRRRYRGSGPALPQRRALYDRERPPRGIRL